MCLIPSYTDIEKNNQVQKVLHLMTLPLDTEEQKKNFLYNLSFMNNMVVKGYKQVRTPMDDVIYSVKSAAIAHAVYCMPERCRQMCDVVYIFAANRQYSFHVRSNESYTCGNESCITKYILWDHVEGGWNLSDEEYRAEVERIRKNKETECEQSAIKRKQWERDIKLRVIRQIYRLKQNRERVEEFKRTMEEKITPAQRRTKTYKIYRSGISSLAWEECWKLWGDKWGFGHYPPMTVFSAWRCAGGIFSDSIAESYAETYYKKVKSYFNL